MNQIVYIKQIAVIESILDKNESNADIGIDILHKYRYISMVYMV